MLFKKGYKNLTVTVDPKFKDFVEDPLKFISDIIGQTVKNDEELIQLITMTGLSSYTLNPINLGIEAPPSVGKTYTAVETLNIFPEKDVLSLGDLSPKALVHEKGELVDKDFNPIQEQINELKNKIEKAEDKNDKEKFQQKIKKIYRDSYYLVDLTNKILLFLESPNIHTWAMLRPILSHDKFITTYKITENSKGGGHKTKTVILKGWPAVIYTKAERDHDEIWDQIKSRFIIVSPNISSEKFKASMEVTNERRLRPKSPTLLKKKSEDLELCKYFIKILRFSITDLFLSYRDIIDENPELIKDISITWCPFQKQLQYIFPSEDGQNMRDFTAFISIMQMSAVLNMLSRPKLIEKEEHLEYIITTIEDFNVAKKIFNRGSVKLKIQQHLFDFYEKVILPLWNEKDDKKNCDLLVKELEDYSKKEHQKLRDQTIRENYLKPLQKLGFVTSYHDESSNNAYRWKPLRPHLDSFIQDEISFSLDDYLIALKQLNDNLIIHSVYVIDHHKIIYKSTENDYKTSSKRLNSLLEIFNKDTSIKKEIKTDELYYLIMNMSPKTTALAIHKPMEIPIYSS